MRGRAACGGTKQGRGGTRDVFHRYTNEHRDDQNLAGHTNIITAIVNGQETATDLFIALFGFRWGGDGEQLLLSGSSPPPLY